MTTASLLLLGFGIGLALGYILGDDKALKREDKEILDELDKALKEDRERLKTTQKK